MFLVSFPLDFRVRITSARCICTSRAFENSAFLDEYGRHGCTVTILWFKFRCLMRKWFSFSPGNYTSADRCLLEPATSLFHYRTMHSLWISLDKFLPSRLLNDHVQFTTFYFFLYLELNWQEFAVFLLHRELRFCYFQRFLDISFHLKN